MSTFKAAITNATKKYDHGKKCHVPLLSLIDDDGETYTVRLQNMDEIIRKDLHFHDLVLVEKAENGRLHLLKAYADKRQPDAQFLVCGDAE